MTESLPHNDPIEAHARHDPPLRLAEDTSELESSRDEISDESSRAGSSRAASASSGSSTAATGGSSTGGFETMLGKIIVSSGLATQEELDHCQTVLDEYATSGEPRVLADVLLEKEYATQHQLNRLRQEFEAKKSGRSIPGYRIIRKLGSGAMATVFLAKQLSLDRPVAIKILPKKFSDNDKFIERFYKEGRAAAQLNHPNIVNAYDVGRAGDHHYFVMEYVDGYTLYDRIQKHKRLKEPEAFAIVKQVAQALEHAHERGFVHRDIKPKNIMITRQGTVKLADLGLARAISDRDAAKAEAGRAFGTPYYISPEQIRGELSIGPPADIYGLGATFYHMVTGRVPFEGKNPSAVMHKHLKSPLKPPDHVNPEISPSCAQVIEMMMSKRASDRYQNVSDLLEDLDLVSQGQPPHFAHRSLDHAAITDALTDVVEAPPVIPQQIVVAKKPSTPGPLFMTVVVLLGVSSLLNLILLLFALS